MKFRLGAFTAAAVAASLALVGCSPSEESASNSGQDAAELVQQSAEAMRDVTSAHVVLTADGKVPNLKVSRLEADVASKPEEVGTGEVTIDVGSEPVTAQIIYVDGHLYSDIAEAGSFTDYGRGNSIYDVSVILDAQNGIANALANLRDPKSEGNETVDGTKATKISATSSTNDVAMLSGLSMAPEQARDIPVTVWIADEAPHHLVKAQIEPVPDATVTMTLSDFGKPVEATKPEVATP